MILYLAPDLLWASKIRSAAKAVAVPVRPIHSLDALRDRPAGSDFRGILADLESTDLAFAIIDHLRGPASSPADRSITIVAWAPHVETALIERARAAGCDAVLPRGLFEKRLESLLKTIESRAPLADITPP